MILSSLLDRAGQACELCNSTQGPFQGYLVPLRSDEKPDNMVLLCSTCHEAIQQKNYTDPNHFQCLTGSIWSETPAVKVLSYKVLGELLPLSWAQEARENAYLTEEELAWANGEADALAGQIIHKDAYGTVLQNGDTVLLTENLNVKGANLMAAKGTKVPKIRLVADNAEQIEGKIEHMTIVILTKFVRKA